MEDNFAKYFLKKGNNSFEKNLKKWKEACLDFLNYNGDETVESIFLFYFPGLNICQHPECKNKTSFISMFRGFKKTCSRKHSMELTSLQKYGVKYKSSLPEFREQVRKTNLERYNLEYPAQREDVREKIRNTNFERYGFGCALQSPEIKEKIKETNLKNHGVQHPQQSLKIREKTKETNLSKWGVEYPIQSQEIKEKLKQTFLENYGVEHPMYLDETKEKIKKTNLQKYGHEYATKSVVVKEKTKQTNLDKFGYENNFLNPTIREKIKETFFEKYGCENPMQNEKIKEKAQNTNFKKYGFKHIFQSPKFFENSPFKRKEYIWKSGESSFIQGYEPIVLKELEDHGYLFNEVKTSPSDMPEIWYEFENKKRRYYPDFFIPKENLIIEVKSAYILEKQSEQNKAKFKAVQALGFNFKLEIR